MHMTYYLRLFSITLFKLCILLQYVQCELWPFSLNYAACMKEQVYKSAECIGVPVHEETTIMAVTEAAVVEKLV